MTCSSLSPPGGREPAAAPSRPPGPAPTEPTTPAAPAAPKITGIPVPLTPLVDREPELATATDLLASGGARLLSITGPGGVGKTRLAIRLATETAGSFADGGCWVDLAPLHDPDLVLPTIAQALGPRGPLTDPILASLAREIADQHLLLVLDNFEHVLDAAPALGSLLARCQRLRLIVTSRAPLRLSGEHEVPVTPLALPDRGANATADEIARSPAVHLFIARAKSTRPDIELTAANANDVAAICARVDGLPLAIEMAASWTRLLPPAALLARLTHRLPLLAGGSRDLPHRQQTMRDAIAWSVDLLSPAERWLFRLLAIFPASFALDAVEAIADAGTPSPQGSTGAAAPSAQPPPVLDLLSGLVEKNLITAADGASPESRFRMFGTVREFAAELRTTEAEWLALGRRHASYFLALAERSVPALAGPDQGAWLLRLEADQDNFRAALHWALEAGEAELAVRLAAALWPFWERRGYPIEGATWLQRALALGTGPPPALRARALHLLGNLSLDIGDLPAAERWYDAALTIWRQLDDDAGLAAAVNGLGIVAFDRADLDRARALHDESLALRRRAGRPTAVALSLYNLGRVADGAGDADTAARLLGESLSIRRAQHDDRGVAYATWALGRLALHQGHAPIASQHLEQARSRFRDLRDRFGTAFALHDLGLVALHNNDPRQAIVLLDEALALRHELGERKGVVESLEGLALLARATGQARAAAELLGAAAEQRLILGTPLLPIERPPIEREVSLLRSALGRDPFAAAWTIGRSRSLDEATIAATAFLSNLPSEPPPPAPALAPAAERPVRSGTLSSRELDVLRLIAEGHTSREIADLLFLSHRTVSTHLTNIFNKLGVSSRSAAAAHAVRHRLV